MKNLLKKNQIFGLITAGILFSLAFVLITGTVRAADHKQAVGYIDMEKIQKTLPEFKDLQEMASSKDAELNSFAQYVQTQFTNTRAGLEKERDTKKQGKSAEEKSSIDKEYNELIKKALEENQKKIENEKARLSAELQNEYDKVMEKLSGIVEKAASDAGVSVVLEKKLIFYGGVDLTEKVLTDAQKGDK